VKEYAPVVYLANDYLPISLFDYLDNMKFVNIEGKLVIDEYYLLIRNTNVNVRLLIHLN